MRFHCQYLLLVFGFFSCSEPANSVKQNGDSVISYRNKPVAANTPVNAVETARPGNRINTGNTTPAELIAFARSLTGTPYKYGSTDPAQGFDCSGFITYVFNHFNIAVPRSSVDFTNVPRAIDLKDVKTGDLVLFTGTDSTIRTVGHMGIFIAEPGQELKFIHSTSGKAYGVTETPLNTYYMGRYMKALRIFPQNDQ